MMLVVNLVVLLLYQGYSVVLLDMDLQGSLGCWFMEWLDCLGENEVLEFGIFLVWGVSYEFEKLKKCFDFVIIDMLFKIDSDLWFVLWVVDLVVVLVVSSQVDFWVIEGVLDLVQCEKCDMLIVLNCICFNICFVVEIVGKVSDFGVEVVVVQIVNCVVYVEMLGIGFVVVDLVKSSIVKFEMDMLMCEVLIWLL